jgi:hypothetical protein
MTQRRTFDSTAGPPRRGIDCTLTPPPSHATSVLDSSTPPPTGDRPDGNKSLYLGLCESGFSQHLELLLEQLG